MKVIEQKTRVKWRENLLGGLVVNYVYKLLLLDKPLALGSSANSKCLFKGHITTGRFAFVTQ